MFYAASFVLASIVCFGFYYLKRQADEKSAVTKARLIKTVEFTRFQRNYLAVYLLAMFADWLNGPYVYALYQHYGFDSGEIAQLFIGGFGASMFLGTFAGALSDTYGRRAMTLTFAVCYFAAGVTKMFPDFWILMFGRLLSGVATSLLFSVLEAWMVCEHHKRGFDASLLSDTFSIATTGNGLVAVFAGLFASAIAEQYGFVAPFIAALVPLFVLGAIVYMTWTENYGDQTLDFFTAMTQAASTLRKDRALILLGGAQSCFEGAMYTFVFMWTPALATESTRATLPYGLIFAVYMVCIMIGSYVFSLLVADGVARIPLYVHGMSGAAMLLVAVLLENKAIVYLMFLVFEVACGMFFPSYGTLRSMYIPEASRAAVMNYFRIPLNAIVLLLLLKVKFMPVESVFFICALFHGASLMMFSGFVAAAKGRATNQSSTPAAAH
eukprot:Amastigsp_a841276_152.p1 type:complete len:439 gc:universal Amastigsp_a841276_152:1375-59(-)